MGNKASCIPNQNLCCYVENKGLAFREAGELIDIPKKEHGPMAEFPAQFDQSKQTTPPESKMMSPRDRTPASKKGSSERRKLLEKPEEQIRLNLRMQEKKSFQEVKENDEHLFSSVSSIDEFPGPLESDASQEEQDLCFVRPRKVKIVESKWHVNPPENITFLETVMTVKEQEGIMKAMSSFYLFEKLSESEK